MTRKEQVLLKAREEVVKKQFTQIVENYIQKELDKYNKVNGTLFEKIHNCAAYKDISTYPHQQFCIDILEWNAEVWETARGILYDVKTGVRSEPTVDDFIDELPEFAQQ